MLPCSEPDSSAGAGGLGHGDTVDQPEPALVEYFADEGIKVKSVRCGSRHTIVLTTDGRVFTFGNGEFGRLGNGNMKQLLPQEVEMFEGKTFSEVQAGRSFSLALESNGTLWGFGKNDHSQLGLGANMAMDMNTMEEYPVPIDRLQGPVASIAAGARHSVVCNTEGALYYWGQRTWIEPQLMTNVEEKIISVCNSPRAQQLAATSPHTPHCTPIRCHGQRLAFPHSIGSS